MVPRRMGSQVSGRIEYAHDREQFEALVLKSIRNARAEGISLDEFLRTQYLSAVVHGVELAALEFGLGVSARLWIEHAGEIRPG